jgi:ABC-type sugar transport system permease subunit
MGFNGVRKHQKIEDPRYLYWADKLGLLVWEEMPSAYRFTKRSVERLTKQWMEAISRDASHPCIIAWVPFNESWGVPDLPAMPEQRHWVASLYHLTNTLTGVTLTYLTFVLPFAVWTLRGFILGIPKDLEEAAMVDGSSRVGAFVRILLPLVAPGLVATSVFAFITSWNEYIFASVLLSDQSNQTVTVWLSYFYGTSRNTDWGALMAASTLTAVPVIIFFLLVQRRIMFGLTSGAVRG